MSFFNQYPYININDLNLDFILNAIKEMRNEVTNFVSINAIKYADPIQWNITSQYEKNTIVIDPQTGTAYISVAPVPSGVALTRDEYWTVVFDLGSFVTRAAKNFTTRYEQDTTLTATFNSVAGDWLVWGDTLYVANVNITAGDSYVVDGNIRRITVEEVKNTIMQLIADNYDAIVAMIGDLNDLTTTAKNNVVAAINELVTGLSNEVQARQDAIDDITNDIGVLSDLETTDTSNIVGAINEVLSESGTKLKIWDITEHGAIGDGVTDCTQAIQDGIDSDMLVYIPEGIYATHTLTCKYGTVIMGKTDGYGLSGSNGSVLKSLDTSGAVIEIPRLCHKVILQNFAINGQAANTNAVDGILISHTASDFYLMGIYVQRCRHGINCGSTGWSTIFKCFVENCYGDGFHFENGNGDSERPMQVNVINCLSEHNNGNGFEFINTQNAVAPAGTVLNCGTFANNGFGIRYTGTNGYSFSAARVDNCFFGEDNAGEVRLLYSMDDYPITISNCQIELAGTKAAGVVDAPTTATHNTFGLLVSNGADAMVSNCFFSNNSASGLLLSNGRANLSNCKFKDNAIYTGVSEIISDQPSRLQISNCRFKGYDANKRGIQLYNADDWLTAIGNTFETETATTAIVTLSTNTKIHTYMNVINDGSLLS